jgi:hypothetical protein
MVARVIRPRFLDVLALEEVDVHCWKLAHELRFDSAVMGARIIVPEGRLTDLASVPRIPFAYWLAGDTGRKAAVIHDELYRVRLCPRAVADAVFREALRAEGLPAWRVALMYAGVRVGGWVAW